MKTNRLQKIIGILSLAGLTMAGLTPTRAQDVPDAINYQGRLTDNLGNSLASGYYEIAFRIWDDLKSTNQANLIWGRSFPLHVVEGGLFNILLSNDGGTNSPMPLVGDLREAFADEDRYLGLTITKNPSGTVSPAVEISPRQKMASAPFAMQAETANKVRDLAILTEALADQSVIGTKIALNAIGDTNLAANAVTTAAIANGSVTQAKIASGAVTEAKIAAGAVGASQLANGAVTASKISIDGDLHLENNAVYLRGSGDNNHGLQYAGTFAGGGVDGPALFGFGAGMLGTKQGGEKKALEWDSSGGVSLFGNPIDLSSHVASATTTPTWTANCDGIMVFYGRRGYATLYLTINGVVIAPANGLPFYYDVNGGDGLTVTWPLKKGSTFRWAIHAVDSINPSAPNVLQFVPMGLARGSDALTAN